MRRLTLRYVIYIYGLLAVCFMSPVFAQDATPTATPEPEPIELPATAISADNTLIVYLPAEWGALPTTEAADLAVSNDPEAVSLVGSTVPETGQVHMQISAIGRDQLTPAGLSFDLTYILDTLTSSFTDEEGTNPFDEYIETEINDFPALATEATVDLFEQPAQAYLMVIDRETDNRVLLFITLTAPDDLETFRPTIDAIIERTLVSIPKAVFSEPITSVDGLLTLQTPQNWYARSIGASGLVLAPFPQGIQIESLERINPGQVVIQVSAGTRKEVFANHSKSVRELAAWTLLGFRQPDTTAVTEGEINNHATAHITITSGEDDAQVELAYLFVDYDSYIVWFSVVAPPQETAQYQSIVETLVATLEVKPRDN